MTVLEKPIETTARTRRRQAERRLQDALAALTGLLQPSGAEEALMQENLRLMALLQQLGSRLEEAVVDIEAMLLDYTEESDENADG